MENEQKPEAENGSQPAAVAEKPKKGLLPIIIIPLLILTMSAGAFLAYSQYPLLNRAARNLEKSGKEEKELVDEEGATEGEEGEEDGEAEEGEEEEEGHALFVEIPDLVVNPVATDGRRYLMASVGVECSEEPIVEEIKEKDVVIRDAIINALSSRTVTELSDIQARTQLKEELKELINSNIKAGKIKRLYFTQYVLQ